MSIVAVALMVAAKHERANEGRMVAMSRRCHDVKAYCRANCAIGLGSCDHIQHLRASGSHL